MHNLRALDYVWVYIFFLLHIQNRIQDEKCEQVFCEERPTHLFYL